jgi:Rha family phage regulatory protein
MNDLVIMHDREAVTSSMMVAKVFGKDHRNVLRDIRHLVEGLPKIEQAPHMFVPGTMINEQNRQEYPVYYMNRDGFTLLAMGFTGAKAMHFKLQYIQAFNIMEIQLKSGYRLPQTFSESLRMLADAEEEKAKMLPKVQYFDLQMHNPGLMTTTVIAKSYGKSAIWLNKQLQEARILYRQGKVWVLRQEYSDCGYAAYENFSDLDNDGVHPLLKWTQKGQKFIYDLLEERGCLPIAQEIKQLGGIGHA